ncbi:MAG: hypothetical protein AAGF12_10445 [Myxococcota bacterium]
MKLHYFACALATFVLTLTGCGGPDEYAVTGTDRAAGADGMVVVETIEGGNRMVRVDINHLPPPSRLGDGLATYVVWFRAPDNTSTMASALEYDEDERTGTATATTPMTQFTVVVTAERDTSIAEPGDIVVARQEVGGSD